jgi:hypothetical protein
VLVITLVQLDRGLLRQPLRFTFAILLCAAYVSGALMEVNRLADRSKPRVFPVAVRGKRVEIPDGWSSVHGSTLLEKKSTEYLTLAPWGPQSKLQDVSVPTEFYRSKQIGDTVCAQLRPGAIGIRWFVVTDCAANP